MKHSFIACYKPLAAPKLRLFCFHHAGGGASSYRNWQPYFEPLDIEIVPIQLPGRENRISEPLVTDISELTIAMVDELNAFVDLPFALWGHSMGAALAFEFGVRIKRVHGLTPVCLFASAKGAPHMTDEDEAATINMSDDEFVESVRKFGGLPDKILADAEMLGLVLPALRADFELCERYVYEDATQLECPIFGYGGIQDKTVKHESLLAWESVTSASFKMRRFPGDHFYVHSQSEMLMKAVIQDLMQQLSDT